jgi:small-conductance mechanosensitive channel
MSYVNISCWTYNGGESLYKGDWFENALLEELKETKKFFADDEKFKLLFEKLEELKETDTPEEILGTLFQDNVTMDFEFAKQLRLFEVITPGCFHSETEVGKALIYLMDFADFSLVLSFRKWTSTDEIFLEFELAHRDTEEDVYLRLSKEKIKYK